MNDMNKRNNIHKCVAVNSADTRCQFCRICGIYLSKTNTTTVYYRSSKYNMADPFRLDGNLMISEMIKKQGNNRYYNIQAHHLGYRTELISFVEELALKLDYKESTFYLAIAILDALLSLYSIERSQIKMVSFMALNLAAKMEEKSSKIPELTAISQLFENQFDIEELGGCETLLSSVLSYNFNIKTPQTFLELFLSKGITSNKDLGMPCNEKFENKMLQFESLIAFFLQISISHYIFYKYTSIAVAASIIAAARKLIGFENVWTNDLENLTRVSWESIEDCTNLLYEAASQKYPVLTPQIVLGAQDEEFEIPQMLNVMKNNGSIFTEATSEKDEHFIENIQVSEFKLYESDDEGLEESERFVLPFDLNIC